MSEQQSDEGQSESLGHDFDDFMSELKMGVKLLQLEQAKETAAEDILAQVENAAGEKDVPVYYASS